MQLKGLIENFYLIERKNIKFKAIVGLLLFFVISTFIYLEKGEFRKLEPIAASDVMSINAALERYQNVDASDPAVASPMYQNIVEQARHLTRRQLALTIADQDLYVDASMKLHGLRVDASKLADYEEIATFLPSETEMNLDYIFIQTIDEQEKTILLENDNFPTYIILLFFTLGFGWYLLVAVFSSDILIDEDNHPSVVSGYPYTEATKLVAKTIFYVFVVIALLILTVSVAIISAGSKFGFDWTYPIAVFNSNYLAIPVWQFIILSTSYLLMLSIAAISISILLNYYIRNLYFVIFIHFFLFFFIHLTGKFSGYTWFLPYNYLNYSAIYTGETTEITGVTYNNITFGFIILTLFTLFIITFIYMRLKWNKADGGEV